MATTKATTPKGTRDFGPEEMGRRNYIFDTIKGVYRKYGFQPIETPAMETLQSLMGKYGEEGDKLLFKILNSGDYLKNATETDLAAKDSVKTLAAISEKGLRYDLTVPFARFVVQHQSDIVFPFKRYQIQPVWRADKPQKGRYREFYQCDADVVGSNSLLNEVELLQIIDEVFSLLKVNITIKLNNRKILSGIAEIIGEADKITDITVAIDKLDKIGIEKVNQELENKGITTEKIAKLQPIIQLTGSNAEKLATLKEVLALSEIGLRGVAELETVFDYIGMFSLNNTIELDLTLARGLNYYTGAIVEVKANDVAMGSVCGGGRYDDLTGVFGLKGVSGVGISFGADRIYDVLQQLDIFPDRAIATTDILFVNFGETETRHCLKLVQQLRASGLSVEMYPDAAKMKKQMSYADRKKVRFVALVGENEIAEGKIMLKNMAAGEQNSLTLAQVIETAK